ncbi:hypothetical protein Tco_0114719 [Tanacetum coccineum]
MNIVSSTIMFILEPCHSPPSPTTTFHDHHLTTTIRDHHTLLDFDIEEINRAIALSLLKKDKKSMVLVVEEDDDNNGEEQEEKEEEEKDDDDDDANEEEDGCEVVAADGGCG